MSDDLLSEDLSLPPAPSLDEKPIVAPPAQPLTLDDRPFCVQISSSQDLMEDSPLDKAPQPAPADDAAAARDRNAELHTSTPGEMEFLRRLSHIDAAFPPPIRGEFQPSEFQRAVLADMQRKRAKFGHKHGLSIMATAVGKVSLHLTL